MQTTLRSSLGSSQKNPSEIKAIISEEINNFTTWCQHNKQHHNQEKSQLMIFSRQQIFFQEPLPINTQSTMKILGAILNNRLTWHDHAGETCKKASKRLYILRTLKALVSPEELHEIYMSVVRAVFDYASVLFVGLEVGLSNKLQRIDKRAHRIISHDRRTCECGSNSLSKRREELSMTLFRKIMSSDHHILEESLPCALPHHNRLANFYCRTDRRQRSFFPQATFLWNQGRL